MYHQVFLKAFYTQEVIINTTINILCSSCLVYDRRAYHKALLKALGSNFIFKPQERKAYWNRS